MIPADAIASSVPLSDLVPSPFNPRRVLLGDVKDDLVESIRRHGILEPLLVRKVAPDKLEIVAGERRFVAAKYLKLGSVPIRIAELTDEQAHEVQLVENLQRRNLSPLEEAAALSSLRGPSDEPRSAAEIAALVGLPLIRVAKYLSLATLAEQARQMLAEGKMPLGVAFQIARLPAAVQAKVLEENAFEIPRWTDSDARSAIARSVMLKLAGVPWDRAEESLFEGASSCNACPKRSGATPALFTEIMADEEVCLDPGCFSVKARIFAERAFEKARIENPNLLALSTDYYSASKAQVGGAPVILAVDWEEAKKSKAGDPGIIVHGKDVERYGQILKVKRAREEAAEEPGKVVSTSKEAQAQAKKAADPSDPASVKGAARRDMRAAVIGTLKTKLSRVEPLAPMLLARLFDAEFKVGSTRFANYLDAVGLKPKERERIVSTFAKPVRVGLLAAAFAQLKPAELAIELLTFDERKPSVDAAPALEALCELAGLSVRSFMPKPKEPKAPKAKAAKAARPKAKKPAAPKKRKR